MKVFAKWNAFYSALLLLAAVITAAALGSPLLCVGIAAFYTLGKMLNDWGNQE